LGLLGEIGARTSLRYKTPLVLVFLNQNKRPLPGMLPSYSRRPMFSRRRLAGMALSEVWLFLWISLFVQSSLILSLPLCYGTLDDVEEVDELFSDAKKSARLLAEEEEFYLK
jgi:hypothetical protein